MHAALTQLHSMENCLFHTSNQCVCMCVWGGLAIHANAHSLSVRLDDTMYDGNVPSFHLEHYNLPHYNRVISVVGQKEKVTAIKGWLHTTTEGYGERQDHMHCILGLSYSSSLTQNSHTHQ